VSVDFAGYNPIYIIKNTEQEDGKSYLKYMAVPAAKYASAEEKPEIFTDDGQWRDCKNAFTAICELAENTNAKLVLNELSGTDKDGSDMKI
jgi:hypothetical protein